MKICKSETVGMSMSARNSVLECALGCAKPRTGAVRGFVLLQLVEL